MDAALSSIKDDTNDKCKTLADTVLKLYGRIANLETGTRGGENSKLKPKRLAGKKELANKTKPASKKDPVTKSKAEAKKNANEKVKPNTHVPKPTILSKPAPRPTSSPSASNSVPRESEASTFFTGNKRSEMTFLSKPLHW